MMVENKQRGVRSRNERLRRQKRNREADKLTADGRK